MKKIFHFMNSWTVRYGANTVAKCMALGIAGFVAWPQAVSATNVATTPEPWSGQRHKSCDVYHSSKYKKPLYDSGAINFYLKQVLGVDNTTKLFYRWERPVRYYLEVPPEAPQLAKEFEAQVAKIAKYTGLDMARHDKPYMEYKDPKLNNKSQWPGGLSTNVIFIITTDVGKTVQDPFVSKLLKGFGVTPEREMAEWNYARELKKNSNVSESFRYGHDPDGLKFAFLMTEPKEFIATGRLINFRSSLPHTVLASLTLVFDTKDRLLKPNSSEISELTQQFLRVLYGPHVQSGMLLIKAKRLMMEELIDCFNTKGA